MKSYLVVSATVIVIAASVAIGRPLPQGFSAPLKPPNTVVEPDSPLNRQLVAAVRKADVSAVTRLLDQGASVDVMIGWDNAPDRTPLVVMASFPGPMKNGMIPETVGPDNHRIFDLLVAHIRNPNVASNWSGETPLMAAAELGGVPAAKHLIDAGARVDARTIVRAYGSQTTAKGTRTMQGGGQTALQWTLDNYARELSNQQIPPIVTYLISRGADVNAQDVNGHTPLMAAAQYGDVPLVKELIAKGADPAKRDTDGRDALTWASMTGRSNVAAILAPLATSHMTLFEAATFGKIDQMKRCLDAGADPNALDWRGWTPLMSAVSSNSNEAVNLLIDRGAKVNGSGRLGSTALQTAASSGFLDIAKTLIERGADVNQQSDGEPDGRFRRSPLLAAISASHAAIVELLLTHHVDLTSHEAGANALVSAVRQCGTVTNGLDRHRAAPRPPKRSDDQVLDDQWRIVEVLLNHGVSARSNHSQALNLAASKGQAGIVDLLLKHGADINARCASDEGREQDATPLRAAIDGFSIDGSGQQHAMETIKLLLSRHADVTIADEDGVTPLQFSVQTRRRDLVSLLLAHGAKVNTVDSDGFTPLMTSAVFCDVAMAQLLVAHGAASSVNRPNRLGYTPLMLTAYVGSPWKEKINEDGAVNIKDELDSEGGWQNSFDGILNNHDRENEPSMAARVGFVKFLLAHHTAVAAKGPGGVTALSLARKNGMPELVRLLSHRS